MGGCRRHIKFANDWTTSLCSLVLVPLTGSFSNVSCDMAHTGRNEVLLGVLAGLFVCIIFLVLSALRKAVSSTVSVGMLLFYELAQIIMYVTLFLQGARFHALVSYPVSCPSAIPQFCAQFHTFEKSSGFTSGFIPGLIPMCHTQVSSPVLYPCSKCRIPKLRLGRYW